MATRAPRQPAKHLPDVAGAVHRREKAAKEESAQKPADDPTQEIPDAEGGAPERGPRETDLSQFFPYWGSQSAYDDIMTQRRDDYVRRLVADAAMALARAASKFVSAALGLPFQRSPVPIPQGVDVPDIGEHNDKKSFHHSAQETAKQGVRSGLKTYNLDS